MKIFTFILLLIPSLCSAQVVSIVANTSTGQYLQPGGAVLSNNTTVDFGEFDITSYNALPPTSQTDPSSITPLFNFVGATQSYTSGIVNSSNIPVSGGTGDAQLHILVQDPINNLIGIFTSTSPAWAYPASALDTANLVSSVITSAVLGTIVPNSSPPPTNNFELVPIPEPSSYALFLGVLALGGIFLRRRRVA